MANKFITSVDATDTTKEEDLFFVNVDKKIKQIQKDNLRFDYEKHIENKPSIDGVEMVGDKSLDDFGIPNKKELDNIKTDIEELQHRMSPAIVNTASGETVLVKDSSDTYLENLILFGRSEQVQTTGAQMLNPALYDKDKTDYGITSETNPDGSIHVKGTLVGNEPFTMYLGDYIDIVEDGETYSYYSDTNRGLFSITYDDGKVDYINSITVDKSRMTKIRAYIQIAEKPSIDKIVYPVMVKNQTVPTKDDWEPYTGRKPAPNVDYPQDITNIGENGTIKIKLQGKNLIPFPYLENNKTENGITWIVHDNGAITVKGTATEEVYFNLCNVDFGPEDFFTYDHVNYREYTVSVSKTPKNVHMSYSGATKLCYLTVQSGKTVDATLYPQIEYGRKEVATDYEPWKGEQTITIPLERPLARWNRIEKRNNVWGIARKTAEKILDGTEEWGLYKDFTTDGLKCYVVYNVLSEFGFQNSICTHFKNVDKAWINGIGKNGYYSDHDTVVFKYFITDKPTLEEFKVWLLQQKEAGTPVKLVYKTQTEIWEPLPQETQQALNALHTYYPNTTVTNSEDAHMEVSYVADTKLYIDSKLQEIVKEQLRTNELILERTM